MMRTPSGVAAIEGLLVSKERFLLQQARKMCAGTHEHAHMQFLPGAQFIQVNGKWISVSEFVTKFRKGQRRKTRSASADASR